MRLWIVYGNYGSYSMSVHIVMARTEVTAIELIKTHTKDNLWNWEQCEGEVESYRLHKEYNKDEARVVSWDSYIE